MIDEFEWDAEKATTNPRKHGVAFKDARLVFDDLFAAHRFDVDAGYGEQRMIATGMVNGVVLTVVYTERNDRILLISARRATKHEQREYYNSQTSE